MIFTAYEPELINDFAIVPLFVGMAFAGASGIVYGFGAAWWRSLLGAAFFGVMVTSCLPLLVVLGRRLFGEYPGYEWVALVTYTLWALSWIAMLCIIVIERRRPGVVLHLGPERNLE